MAPYIATASDKAGRQASAEGSSSRNSSGTGHQTRTKNDSTDNGKRGPWSRGMSPSKRFKGKLKGGDDDEDAQMRSPKEVDAVFMAMLNNMQVPSAMLAKLMSLDVRVKEAMLKGRDSLTLASLSAATTQSTPLVAGNSAGKRQGISHLLRKTRSNSSFANAIEDGDTTDLPHPDSRASIFGNVAGSRTPSGGSSGSEKGETSRQLYSNSNVSSTSLMRPRSRAGSFSSIRSATSAGKGSECLATALTFATMLKANDTSRLDIAKVKRMRAIISSESPVWLTEFFEEGGYSAMLARLKELLEMEWREEQRDDNLLHELLRCFLALSSTDCGRAQLASSVPSPYAELASLLFSEKRPGDLSTRKLLIDLLYTLSELPGPSAPTARTHEARSQRVTTSLMPIVDASKRAPPHFSLLLALLHNARDPSKEAIVEFVAAGHTPRPFKSLVTELLNVNRDYFWVFCHGSNRFWALRDINVADVEGPKVPGGMTGGVEFEAMAYQTSLLRLINLLASRIGRIGQSEGHKSLAYEFHQYLFSSGLQKTLSITRKASQVYYQPLHLELSRYFDYARRANFPLPADLEMYQSAPQFLQIAAQFSSTNESSAQPSPGGKAETAGKDAIAQGTSFLPLPSSGSSTALPPQHLQQKAKPREQDCSQLRSPLRAEDKRRSSAKISPSASSPIAKSNRGQVPSPKGQSRAPLTATTAAQLSVVGDAVKKWERLAGSESMTAMNSKTSAMPSSPSRRQANHLGLGWAPAA